MVTLQSKMEYCTDILKTLLAELIEKCIEGEITIKIRRAVDSKFYNDISFYRKKSPQIIIASHRKCSRKNVKFVVHIFAI